VELKLGESADDGSQNKTTMVDGKETTMGMSASKKAFYPAHEALCDLTGAYIPPKMADWTRWWKNHKDTFVFPFKYDFKNTEKGDQAVEDASAKDDSPEADIPAEEETTTTPPEKEKK
ncbi:MAG: hypothetical protein JXR97_15510, partial [Planctomycetes bacterium]|nr:hypothetical protein [Planctomycetota bacterium]